MLVDVDLTAGGEAMPLWHVTLTVAGDACEPDALRLALDRLVMERPFMLSVRYDGERAEPALLGRGRGRRRRRRARPAPVGRPPGRLRPAELAGGRPRGARPRHRARPRRRPPGVPARRRRRHPF
nr:hypothetical protein [Angustibacter aerolatus]